MIGSIPIRGTDVAGLVPLDTSFDIFDLLKLVAQFDDREVNHTGVETQGASDGRLNRSRGVEAHDKVVAFTVSSLVLGGDLRQAEYTPVGETSDDAAGSDNLSASITSDSVRRLSQQFT